MLLAAAPAAATLIRRRWLAVAVVVAATIVFLVIVQIAFNAGWIVAVVAPLTGLLVAISVAAGLATVGACRARRPATSGSEHQLRTAKRRLLIAGRDRDYARAAHDVAPRACSLESGSGVLPLNVNARDATFRARTVTVRRSRKSRTSTVPLMTFVSVPVAPLLGEPLGIARPAQAATAAHPYVSLRDVFSCALR